MTYLLFLIGFPILIKGADILVEGSSALARKFKISDIVIGLTIVAFGTSAPELVVNLNSIFAGSTELAIGNIIGSNIVNIFFILGISAIIFPLVTQKNTILKEIPFSLLAAVVVFFLANDFLIDGKNFSELTRADGLVLLSFFAIFMYYIVGIAKDEKSENSEHEKLSNSKIWFYIIGGLVALIVGGKWIVDGAILIAQNFGISQSLIGLTIVAIGTSLPELATSVVAAYKKNTDIAIGNVIGSNIFNIFFILGISAFIKPLPFQAGSNVDILMVIAASLILFIFMFIGKKHTLEKWQGSAMVAIYFIYIVYLVFTR